MTFPFPILRRSHPPDLYDNEPSVIEPGVCMRPRCGDARWNHPEKGELVLCQSHAEEVFRGETRAPPLRTVRDYQTTLGTFLVK